MTNQLDEVLKTFIDLKTAWQACRLEDQYKMLVLDYLDYEDIRYIVNLLQQIKETKND